jgi:hypothetical protein
MNLVLLAAGLALVALPGWTATLGRRLAPPEWARLTSLSLSTGLAAVRLGLLITAAPTALRVIGVHDLADACHRTLEPVAPGGALTGAASAAALILIQTRISRAHRRSREVRRTLRIEPWLGQHHAIGEHEHELVVVPSASTLAYALAGSPPQIVLSRGLASTLSADELGAVVRHERCHLDHDHQHYLDLAVATDVALHRVGFARRSTSVLRLAVERWADEAAAAHLDRTTVRRALAKVVDSMLAPAPAPAFTSAETIGERLSALGTSPRPPSLRWRLAAAGPALVLATLVAATLLTGSGPVHHGLVGLLGYCPL